MHRAQRHSRLRRRRKLQETGKAVRPPAAMRERKEKAVSNYPIVSIVISRERAYRFNRL